MKNAIFQIFSGNLASKILGAFREVVGAALFGTGVSMAAYRVSQTGTSTPVNFFTSDSLNAIFIPQYKKYKDESEDLARAFVWSQIGLFGVISIFLSILLYAYADSWIDFIAPGSSKELISAAHPMLKVMAVGVPFYLMSAVFMFVLMASDDFSGLALRATAQNLGAILFVFLAYYTGRPVLLAWGFTATYVVFFLWIVRRCYGNGSLKLPENSNRRVYVKVVSRFMGSLRPLLPLPFFMQGNVIVERAVASYIGVNAIASLDYAKFISETLLLLISVPIAYVGLRRWSGLAQGDLKKQLIPVVEILLLISCPISIFIGIQADNVVDVLFRRGAFDLESKRVTAEILFGFAIGLWAQVVGYVLVKALNAQLRNGTVLIVTMASLSLSSAFNWFLHPYFGAATLGYGSAIYGISIFACTVVALKLWNDVWRTMAFSFFGGIGYLAFHSLFERLYTDYPLFNLMISAALALAYWAGLYMSRRPSRELFIRTIVDIRGQK